MSMFAVLACGVQTFFTRFWPRYNKFILELLVANENVSLVISRQILSEFCGQLGDLPDAVSKEVAHYTLEKVQPRVVSFEEQVGTSMK